MSRIGDVEYGDVAFGFMRRLHEVGTEEAKQEAMVVHEFHRVFPGVQMTRSERDYNAPREILAAGGDPAGQTSMFDSPSSGPETATLVAPSQTDPPAAAPAPEKLATDMTDAEFLLYLLGDGEWWMLSDILDRSQLERGCGLTVHSRAADLRRNGYIVENTQSKNEADRTDSFYRLAGRTA